MNDENILKSFKNSISVFFKLTVYDNWKNLSKVAAENNKFSSKWEVDFGEVSYRSV